MAAVKLAQTEDNSVLELNIGLVNANISVD